MTRILLIEDDAAIRDVFFLALDSQQYQTVAYDTGSMVIQNEVEAPDIFVIDKNISGTNGLDICRFIKSSERYKHLPVNVISASPDIVHIAKDAVHKMLLASLLR